MKIFAGIDIFQAGMLAFLAFFPLYTTAQTPNYLVLPRGYDNKEADSYSMVPFGMQQEYRLQFFYWPPCFSSPNRLLRISEIALRADGGETETAKGFVSLDIFMYTATSGLGLQSSTFAKNRGPGGALVFSSTVDFPKSAGTTPNNFAIRFPLPIPFTYQTESEGLVVEFIIKKPGTGSLKLDFPFNCPSVHQTVGSLTSCPTSENKYLSLKGTGGVRVGGIAGVNLTNAPKDASAMGLLGLTNTGTFLTLPLPVDLIFFGAAGCYLHQAPMMYLPKKILSNGSATFNFTVPNNYDLLGATLYTQVMLTDPKAPNNMLGLVFSHGLASKITGPEPVGRLFASPAMATSGSFQMGAAPVMRLTIQ